MSKLILSLQPRTNSKAYRYLHRAAMLAFDPVDHPNVACKMHGRDSPIPRLTITINQPQQDAPAIQSPSSWEQRVYDSALKNKLIRFRDMMRLWGVCASYVDFKYLLVKEKNDG